MAPKVRRSGCDVLLITARGDRPPSPTFRLEQFRFARRWSRVVDANTGLRDTGWWRVIGNRWRHRRFRCPGPRTAAHAAAVLAVRRQRRRCRGGSDRRSRLLAPGRCAVGRRKPRSVSCRSSRLAMVRRASKYSKVVEPPLDIAHHSSRFNDHLASSETKSSSTARRLKAEKESAVSSTGCRRRRSGNRISAAGRLPPI